MAEQEAAGGGQIPYIGSLISLVSASGQRYRGTLYTVDLNESTIALQNGARLHRGALVFTLVTPYTYAASPQPAPSWQGVLTASSLSLQ